MGGDGGSIPRRVELVKSKKKPEQANRRAANVALWRYCALSQDRLRVPIVSCRLGRLYNKESVINKMLTRSKAHTTADHIKKLKDVRELRLTVNTSHTDNSDPLNDATGEFYCPITGLEMSGVHAFVYFWTCGCVFSKKALEVVTDSRCMQCGTPFTADDIILINPQTEEEIAAAQKRLVVCSVASCKAKKRPATSTTPHTKPSTSTDGTLEQPAAKESKVDNDVDGPLTPCTSAEQSKVTTKSIQDDPKATSVYKSLFTTSEEAKRQPKAHWVTYNPLYFR
ncbi:Replication termination factor 2 domain containing 1 [Paragonimus heterotremus]|uniref:Replication termination factor 2 n=1 Tax=Paragonimus heterotremus TaxID=100268 RepID=A0A8J4T1Y8_9TREM|nr:Replication termination factor 2 domain containing 1 [Paragonimus heterotremus]